MARTSINCLLLLLLFFTPAATLHAQHSSDSAQIASAVNGDQSDESDDKKKKKKEKEDADQEFFNFSFDKISLSFFGRLGLDAFCLFILVRLIYFPVYKRRDHLFTFFMFNITIFIITFLLTNKSSGFSTGAAFGMFAVFSLLRYRTEDISSRDMTYLFSVIALGLVSSISHGSVLEILCVNSVILVAAFLLDGGVLMKTEFVKNIEYENIELIKPENHDQLMADLRQRTGLDIRKISVGRIDFLRDTAIIKIYYREGKINRAM